MKKKYSLFSIVLLFIFINSLALIEAVENIDSNNLYVEVSEIETDADSEKLDFDAILYSFSISNISKQDAFVYYSHPSDQHQSVNSTNYQQRGPPQQDSFK